MKNNAAVSTHWGTRSNPKRKSLNSEYTKTNASVASVARVTDRWDRRCRVSHEQTTIRSAGKSLDGKCVKNNANVQD